MTYTRVKSLPIHDRSWGERYTCGDTGEVSWSPASMEEMARRRCSWIQGLAKCFSIVMRTWEEGRKGGREGGREAGREWGGGVWSKGERRDGEMERWKSEARSDKGMKG